MKRKGQVQGVGHCRVRATAQLPRLPEPPNPLSLRGTRVLVIGLGRSGRAVARFLLRSRARVVGFDENPEALASPAASSLKRAGMKVTRQPQAATVEWAVVSPGISDKHALVQALRRRSIPVVDELDLASRFVRGPIIAITGTNGKSTTTALIARMLEGFGKSVFCGGNLAPGQPLSAALLARPKDYYVVEVSSFQLERARWLKPKVAVILNITADHLNRHGTVRRYANCKLTVLDRQDQEDYAVLNHDDPLVYAARVRGGAEKHFFSMRHRDVDAYLADGSIWADGHKVQPAREVKLPGAHNIQNSLAAIAAVRLLGVGLPPIRRTLRTFAGLPHRMEHVRRLHGVDYFNSSMTTNPAAGAKSLEAVAGQRERLSSGGKRARRVILIAGGREKALPTAEYVRAMKRHATWVLLVGESSMRLARELSALGFRRFDVLADLPAALVAARAKAQAGDVVLFAPGFASFDQFRDFEARGEAFRKEVQRLD
ncbi:UDP-N-acetylmuramoyl-L-alanine--D-glutamate ligase [candidate division WOR-3 bacterium]|uniref:UDP-N-acetylmuramoylalanine--D-glutamate ligase n=1 Tax=candidate division WOR-3 bacterium TaxID=2052148 RepID=A0A938BTQ3_UNCW3|nr:UDP-N-acetylmuramoyl-L-alanine--D-glutamate ligase [candidate division WOR-3 bacterium]